MAGQVMGRASRTDDHGVAGGFAQNAQHFHQVFYFRGGSGNADPISLLQAKGSGGNEDLASSAHGSHQIRGGKALSHFHQRHPHQGRFGMQNPFHDLEVPSRKGFDAFRRWQLNQVEQLGGGQRIGVDDHGNIQRLLDKAKALVVVFGVADPRNGVSRANFFCHKAAEHIEFVGAGYRNEQIRSCRARFRQGFPIHPVSANAHHVVYIGDLRDHLGIAVHHHHVVPLRDQTFQNRRSDFSSANDNNIHRHHPFF